MLYVDYGFNNKHICIKLPYLSMPMLIRVLKTRSINLRYIENIKSVIKS